MTDTEITFLGTGCALVTKCFNTCFTLSGPSGTMLVDAGGGIGILSRLSAAGVSVNGITDLFLTHTHADHLLGVVWVIRQIADLIKKGAYCGTLTVHSHSKGIETIHSLCAMTVSAKDMGLAGRFITYDTLRDGDSRSLCGMDLQFLDIRSTKELQYGFSAVLPSGARLVCAGDEPLDPEVTPKIYGADWLMSEAFCLSADEEYFQPHIKHHSTVAESARTARMAGARSLILYHTEDSDLPNRKRRYTEEAAAEFQGPVYVPDDLDTITIGSAK